MNREEWRVYNREKQKFYREVKRGKPARPYVKSVYYVNLSHMKTEDILSAAGHCGYCGMLLSSEYHQKHPLVGCLKYTK